MPRVWGKNIWCLGLILLLFFLNPVTGIRINEVELNPGGADSGNEWIELYSENNINLIGYRIKNNDNDTVDLNGNLSGYLIVNFSSQWLDNSDERVFLIFNGSILNSSPLLADSENNNKTWQYCNDWVFNNSTKKGKNFCEISGGDSDDESNNGKDEESAEIYLNLTYDEEMKKDEETEIEIKAFNLEDKKYDVKVFLKDNSSIVSKTLNKEEWKSSNFYIEELLNGPGDKTEKVKLKIENFSGNAIIKARIRENGKSSYLAETEEEITVIKFEEGLSENSPKIVYKEEIIKLNQGKDIKREEIIYKSKSQYIKEYAIYGFSLFCVLIIAWLIFRKFD